MECRVIDRDTWPPKEYLEHYLQNVPCPCRLTTRLDITNLKAQRQKLYPGPALLPRGMRRLPCEPLYQRPAGSHPHRGSCGPAGSGVGSPGGRRPGAFLLRRAALPPIDLHKKGLPVKTGSPFYVLCLAGLLADFQQIGARLHRAGGHQFHVRKVVGVGDDGDDHGRMARRGDLAKVHLQQ